jgi:hypothetical protein
VNLVTLNERIALLEAITPGNGPLTKRDRTLFSLAKCTTWTDEQRALAGKMLDERPSQTVRSPKHVA